MLSASTGSSVGLPKGREEFTMTRPVASARTMAHHARHDQQGQQAAGRQQEQAEAQCPAGPLELHFWRMT
jgi:hypothetical protein